MPLKHPGISALEIERKRAGLTGAELADAIGVSAAHISQIERGWRMPSTRVMERLAAALGKPVDELFPRDALPALLAPRAGATAPAYGPDEQLAGSAEP